MRNGNAKSNTSSTCKWSIGLIGLWSLGKLLSSPPGSYARATRALPTSTSGHGGGRKGRSDVNEVCTKIQSADDEAEIGRLPKGLCIKAGLLIIPFKDPRPEQYTFTRKRCWRPRCLPLRASSCSRHVVAISKSSQRFPKYLDQMQLTTTRAQCAMQYGLFFTKRAGVYN